MSLELQKTETSVQEVWALFKETSRQIKEMSMNTDRKIQEIGKQVGSLTSKWGQFVEGLLAPAVISMFKAGGIELERIYQRAKAHKKGETMEIDILGVNSPYVVLIEAKSTLGADDVKEHMERLKDFKRFFPEYSDKKAIGAVAGIVIDEGVDKFAYRKGLFVIGQSGESVKILNDKNFKPQEW